MSPFLFRDLLYAEQRPAWTVRASLTLLPATARGRRSDSQVRWRPNHNFGLPDGSDFYIGQVEFDDVGTIEPGRTRNVVVRFLDGPGLTEQLVPGRSWRIQEGPVVVATATVVEVVRET